MSESAPYLPSRHPQGTTGAQGDDLALPQSPTERQNKVIGVAAGVPEPLPALPRSEGRSEEHTSELQSHVNLVCRLLLEKKKKKYKYKIKKKKKKKKKNNKYNNKKK